jgi:hypothetical protein
MDMPRQTRAKNFRFLDPADERAVVSVLDWDSLTWSQIPVEDEPISAPSAVQAIPPDVTEIYSNTSG